MPVFLSGRNADDVTRPDFLDLSSPTLCAAATGGHDQGLAQRVCVPCRASAGLERDAGADNTRRRWSVEKRVNTHRAGEPLCRPFAGRL